jgi:hypothetical protein
VDSHIKKSKKIDFFIIIVFTMATTSAEFRRIAEAKWRVIPHLIACFLALLAEREKYNDDVLVEEILVEFVTKKLEKLHSAHKLILFAIYLVRRQEQSNVRIQDFMQNLLTKRTLQNFDTIQILIRTTGDFESVLWLFSHVIIPIIDVESAGLVENLAKYNDIVYQVYARDIREHHIHHLTIAITLLYDMVKSLFMNIGDDISEIVSMIMVYKSACHQCSIVIPQHERIHRMVTAIESLYTIKSE